jgi:hypothetical protein
MTLLPCAAFWRSPVTVAQLLNRPCTVLHRTAGEEEDDYGNAIPDTQEIETVCEIQESKRSLSGRTSEPDSEGENTDTEWLGIFPVGTPLGAADTVRVEGIGGLEVVGEPWEARNPRTQGVSHIEVPLRRTAGAEEGS